MAPLDWGLGHATRCIPIINELLRQNMEVIIAADRRPYELLKKEFPTLAFVRLPGFTVVYPENNLITSTIVRQIPKIIGAVLHEHRALKKIIIDLKIDAVISDNRFGLFLKRLPSFYVTHQIGIMMPNQLRWASRLAYFLNKIIIQKYTACWIPDYAEENNLSGKLSHFYALPNNASFIGPLSRFKKYSAVEKEFDILVLLSGPEPQRTALENIMMEQLKTVHCRTLVVRGIPEKSQRIKISELISVVSSLESEALNRAMLASEIIVSRPGYSTIMDLNVLGKRAIFIPTPGQTEQEYLAAELKRNGRFYMHQQEQFSLIGALKEAIDYPGFSPRESNDSTLKLVIEKLVAQIQGEQITKAQ
ncbi:MAG: glycosyltransferase [Bacteroidota bacterium]